MPAKNRNPHPFKIGDRAKVRDIKYDKIVDSGKIIRVSSIQVVFESDYVSTRPTFYYKRKSSRWVERKKDHFELLPEK